MKRTLLATAILVLLLPGAYAGARDHAYQIKPGLTAIVTVSGQDRHTVSARVGKGPVQQLAVMDDEAVDVFETPDIDHDGYADLAIGQSGGGTQARMRLFLYRPNEGRYQEIHHPAPEISPCHGFVNPVFDAGKPAFSTGCRYSADSQGEESYAVRPDGTAVPVSWITQIWFPQASAKVEARYEFHGDGTVARILLDGEGSPFDGGDNVAPLDRVDLYDAPDITSGPSTQLRAGERYDVVALRPAGWLQVRLPGQKDAAALKWLRYVDLVIDRHGLAPSAQGDAPASDRQAR